MEGTSNNSIDNNINKNDNNAESHELIGKFKEILNDIFKKISTLDSDFEKIKNEPNSLPFTDKGIESLQYIIEIANGPFIRSFMGDLEQVLSRENEKEKFEKTKKLFPFISHLREAQGIVWNIDENGGIFLNSMEKAKSLNPSVSIIEGEDISRIVLFYKLTELLKNDIKEMSRILEENF